MKGGSEISDCRDFDLLVFSVSLVILYEPSSLTLELVITFYFKALIE